MLIIISRDNIFIKILNINKFKKFSYYFKKNEVQNIEYEIIIKYIFEFKKNKKPVDDIN